MFGKGKSVQLARKHLGIVDAVRHQREGAYQVASVPVIIIVKAHYHA